MAVKWGGKWRPISKVNGVAVLFLATSSTKMAQSKTSHYFYLGSLKHELWWLLQKAVLQFSFAWATARIKWKEKNQMKVGK